VVLDSNSVTIYQHVITKSGLKLFFNNIKELPP